MLGSNEATKYMRSKRNESLQNSATSSAAPKKDVPVVDSNSVQNHTVRNVCAPRRPPRRSILMPSEEELESPTYNSDSENHQPVVHQLRSRATTRSSSVPLQRSDHSAGHQIRSTSCANEKKKEEKTVAIELSNNPRNTISPNLSSNVAKPMAVNIDNRRSHLSQSPPPLPARRASAQNKILVSSNTPNTKFTEVSKPLPDKSLQSPSPRVLRPRNTPTVNKQAEPNNKSKIISTPKNMISFSKDKDKSVPTKMTARAVKFFEDNIKRNNNTGLKRKRRSFDASGQIPINKSAKLVRTAHTTRSCTWNNHTLTAQTRSHLPNSLCPKKQQSCQYKLTPNKSKGIKS